MPEVKGMEASEARAIVVEKLKELNALVSIEDYTHSVGKCERYKHTVEPRVSEQWFVKIKDLAKPAIEAGKNREVRFVPEKYEKTYFNWLDNIQDWCISRQLWWGHRIPAYYCDKCGYINVAKTMPETCEKCGCNELHQDEVTLDTWFSSALWPFSTLGWPNKDSEDLQTFFPTNALVTGYDIIFFWIIRMVFSSYYALKQKPFSDVIIHGMVRDSQGRKMSKTLGNGIDPIEVIDKYGADSLRFSVISGTTMGNDIKYMPEKLEQASNFANKIWNAAKFINMSRASDEEIIKFEQQHYESSKGIYAKDTFKVEDKWIINKLNNLVKEITENIEKYDLGVAIVEIRNIRNEKQIHSSKKAELIIVTDKYEKEVKQLESILLKLGYGNSIKIQADKKEIPQDSLSIITDGIELYMPIQGLINIEEERKRLEEERKRLESEVARCEKMLSNPGFVNKAPESKVNEERAKLEKYKDMLDKVKERL